MPRLLLLAGLLALLPAAAAAQDFAVEVLDASPRHHEWVTVDADGRAIHAFVAYPEVDGPVPAVVVIHENRGLTDWVRLFADQLAAEGYLAIAPDLLSDFDDEHDRTSDFASSDDARTALYALSDEQVYADLEAVRVYAAGLPASNGTTFAAGFCWGGARAFRFAAEAGNLAAAFVFYGSPPDAEVLPRIEAPVYGFYGENDSRINETIPETERLMAEHGKTYAYEIYDGAGHAFMRSGADPDGSAENKAAHDDAWPRLLGLLEQHGANR